VFFVLGKQWVNKNAEIDGKTYFVGIDVTRALGYKNANDAVSRHCKGCVKRAVLDNKGITQIMNVVPEGDIYRLAAKSELPGAEAFESWIFDEVLPSIRKHGGYLTAQKIEEVLLNPDTIILLATNLKDEQKKRQEAEKKAMEAEKQIAVLKPKAELMSKVMDCDQKIDVGQAAKILSLPFGGNTLFSKLREKVYYRKFRCLNRRDSPYLKPNKKGLLRRTTLICLIIATIY
jgi:prophage antirepressor-like protein